MKHLKLSLTSILIVSALLLSGASKVNNESKNLRRNQHDADTKPQAKAIQNQQPQVPFAVWQATISALRESLAANKQQAIATQKQAESHQQTFCSPAVVVNELLALIGVGYLIVMWLQWKAIDQQA